jgi:hypothetical protein
VQEVQFLVLLVADAEVATIASNVLAVEQRAIPMATTRSSISRRTDLAGHDWIVALCAGGL